jgi:hypothetical protein
VRKLMKPETFVRGTLCVVGKFKKSKTKSERNTIDAKRREPLTVNRQVHRPSMVHHFVSSNAYAWSIDRYINTEMLICELKISSDLRPKNGRIC